MDIGKKWTEYLCKRFNCKCNEGGDDYIYARHVVTEHVAKKEADFTQRWGEIEDFSFDILKSQRDCQLESKFWKDEMLLENPELSNVCVDLTMFDYIKMLVS